MSVEQQNVEAQQREHQAVREKKELTSKLEAMKELLQNLCHGREKYLDMPKKFPILLRERDNAEKSRKDMTIAEKKKAKRKAEVIMLQSHNTAKLARIEGSKPTF